MTERTLLIVKPDGTRRKLAPKIFKRVEEAGLKILTKKELRLSKGLAERLYEVHKGKDFFAPLIEFVTSGPIETAVIEAEDAISKLRDFVGPTLPSEAPKGTIRGDFRGKRERGESGVIENVVHASDSLENADFEIELIFGKEWLKKK